MSDAGDLDNRNPACEPTDVAAADATAAPDGFTVADTPPPESDDETIARLAKLPLAEYERARNGEATRMGWRVAILDRVVGATRGDHDGGAPKQGRALTLPAPERWPDPVDGAALLDRLAAFFARHVFLPAGAADAMAAWAVHTHCFTLFRHSPRLAFTSPERRCGKTTALDTTALVCCKPLPTANVTAAAVFRTIELAGPTLLIDEADTFLSDNEDLKGILNAGHKRGGQVLRCVGDDAEVRALPLVAKRLHEQQPGIPQRRHEQIHRHLHAANRRTLLAKVDLQLTAMSELQAEAFPAAAPLPAHERTSFAGASFSS